MTDCVCPQEIDFSTSSHFSGGRKKDVRGIWQACSESRKLVISTSLAVCPAAPEDVGASKARPSDPLNDFLGCKVGYFSKLGHKGWWLEN